MTDIYLNDKFIGNVDNVQEFMSFIKENRRKGKLPIQANLYFKQETDELYIDCTKGRARRAVIVVKDGASALTEEHLKKLGANEINWSDLVSQGIIEFIDAAEEENCLVALSEDELTKDHTHLEISPLIIFGVTTSLVPYANFVQAPRLNRGSKTQKQSLGMYATNFSLRMDTDISILHYPQIPITKTIMHDLIGYNKHPSGMNVVIALMSYEGQNMQDSIILNKGSVDRGLARSTYFRPYPVEELRYSGGLTDDIGIPNKDIKGYRSEKDYRFLEDDGITYPEARLREGDVIVGKTSPPRFLGEIEEFGLTATTRRESSVAVKEGEEGIVDSVLVTENEEGNRLIQVRLRDQRIPELGDKFASRHGQKGVIGAIVPEADMPFTESGIRPDIIFSPHSVPSRMTVSHILEVLAGKVGALSGRYIDGTSFMTEKEQDLRQELKSFGFRDNGKEMMYNGITGEMLQVRIFIGNIYYLKLRHMAANKLHARAYGRIQLLTRQPIEGRSKGGGLRLGEMEKDCFVAHGTSLLLKERFDSDKTKLYICENCGMLAMYDSFKGRKLCTRCGSNTNINAIEISYAFKLLLDELRALGISTKIKLKNKY